MQAKSASFGGCDGHFLAMFLTITTVHSADAAATAPSLIGSRHSHRGSLWRSRTMTCDRIVTKPKPQPLSRDTPFSTLRRSGNVTQHLDLFSPILRIRHDRSPEISQVR